MTTTTTTAKRKHTILKRATLLITATLLLTGCAKETTTIIKTDSPDKIEYNLNSYRLTALQFMQWVIDDEPTTDEMQYMLDNRLTAYEASKVYDAIERDITADEFIEANR